MLIRLKMILKNSINSKLISQQSRRLLSKDSKKIASKFLKSDELKDDESYVSSSHLKSMIRFHKIKKPHDETSYEKEYRLKYEKVQLWNHNYWLKNNEQFHEVIRNLKKFCLNYLQSLLFLKIYSYVHNRVKNNLKVISNNQLLMNINKSNYCHFIRIF